MKECKFKKNIMEQCKATFFVLYLRRPTQFCGTCIASVETREYRRHCTKKH